MQKPENTNRDNVFNKNLSDTVDEITYMLDEVNTEKLEFLIDEIYKEGYFDGFMDAIWLARK